jgi:CTP-dependent riboflavin kinase
MKDFKSPFPHKIYYQPNYEKDFDKLKHIPDYRTQLYWNPNMTLDQKEITFYTSDIKGIYQVKIEGFTNEGKYISAVKYFRVE